VELRRKVHQTIHKVTRDIEDRLQMNTAVAALMELYNEIARLEAPVAASAPAVLREALESLLLLLSPFSPHVCEELWARLGHADGLVRAAWPVADEAALREDSVELAVQVNGKVRARVTLSRGAAEAETRAAALGAVAQWTAGKEIAKVMVVPDRLVSVVCR
jgi:leucyl-tRNA synthetase